MSKVFVSRTGSEEAYKEKMALVESMWTKEYFVEGWYLVPWEDYLRKASDSNKFVLSEKFEMFLKKVDVTKEEGFLLASRVFNKISSILNSFWFSESIINTDMFEIVDTSKEVRKKEDNAKYLNYVFFPCEFDNWGSGYDFGEISIKGKIGNYDIWGVLLLSSDKTNYSLYIDMLNDNDCSLTGKNYERFGLFKNKISLYDENVLELDDSDCPFEYIIANLIDIGLGDPKLNSIDEAFDKLRKEIYSKVLKEDVPKPEVFVSRVPDPYRMGESSCKFCNMRGKEYCNSRYNFCGSLSIDTLMHDYIVLWKDYSDKIGDTKSFICSDVFNDFLGRVNLSLKDGLLLADKVYKKLADLSNSFYFLSEDIDFRKSSDIEYVNFFIERGARGFYLETFGFSEIFLCENTSKNIIQNIFLYESEKGKSYRLAVLVDGVSIESTYKPLRGSLFGTFSVFEDKLGFRDSEGLFDCFIGNCPFEYAIANLIDIGLGDPTLKSIEDAYENIKEQIYTKVLKDGAPRNRTYSDVSSFYSCLNEIEDSDIDLPVDFIDKGNPLDTKDDVVVLASTVVSKVVDLLKDIEFCGIPNNTSKYICSEKGIFATLEGSEGVVVLVIRCSDFSATLDGNGRFRYSEGYTREESLSLVFALLACLARNSEFLPSISEAVSDVKSDYQESIERNNKNLAVCNERFEKLFHNTGKELREVLDIMVKEGFPKKNIVNSIIAVLGSVTWDD